MLTKFCYPLYTQSVYSYALCVSVTTWVSHLVLQLFWHYLYKI